MLRRDYILRAIEECVRALARIQMLSRAEQWEEARKEIESELQKLLDSEATDLGSLSETELMAGLTRGPTHLVRDKTFMAAALLKEAGDLAAAENCESAAEAHYLKALNLVLMTLGRGEIDEAPEYVPSVEILRACLDPRPLPLQTNALLMQHYERAGEFAKSESALFSMLEAEPANRTILEFGRTFYNRLATQSDAALAAGNLSRPEAEAGLKELESRFQNAG